MFVLESSDFMNLHNYKTEQLWSSLVRFLQCCDKHILFTCEKWDHATKKKPNTVIKIEKAQNYTIIKTLPLSG